MTKTTRVIAPKKEAAQKQETIDVLEKEISVGAEAATNRTDEGIHTENVIKEKPKREKNTMPKKTAKKEQEIVVTTPSESQQPSLQETSPVAAPVILQKLEVPQTVVKNTEKTAAPVQEQIHSPVSSTPGEAKDQQGFSSQTMDQQTYRPRHYSQQQQQHSKKFVKKQQHTNNNKHPHAQSSHYQSSNQGNQNSQNYNDRYEPRSKEESAPKQPMTREQLEELSLQDLYVHAKRHGVVGAVLMSHKTLVEKILEMQQDPDREIIVEGVLEKLPDGFGFLRSARFDYVSSPDDIYVSPAQIRKMGLRTGDTICGTIRRPKDNEKYFALARIDKVNFTDPAKLHERPHFDRLSPMHPNKKFTLEYLPHYVSTRIMDIFTPIGKGQRGLIVAPPKAGKTVLSKEIAQSLIANHPDIFLIMLLIDERPEEVADMKRFVKGAHAEVISSTFDEPAERHVQVAEAVLEKAKRLVEVGKDVVIFLDSVTRLARAYNTVAPASGKILTGGVDANSLQRPKRFFGAARCLEEGGSLTILGSALIETGSRMDEVIYEEFKGTGNMEIHMSRKLSNRRIYPAFDLLVSGTRRDELLQTEEELNRSWVLQKFLANMNTAEAMEFLLDKMKKFKTNEEFFESMNPKKAANGNGSSSGK